MIPRTTTSLRSAQLKEASVKTTRIGKSALDQREGIRIFGDGHRIGIASQGLSDREESVLTRRV
jgi:hypothetical protein